MENTASLIQNLGGDVDEFDETESATLLIRQPSLAKQHYDRFRD